jgi:hypothetical protein
MPTGKDRLMHLKLPPVHHLGGVFAGIEGKITPREDDAISRNVRTTLVVERRLQKLEQGSPRHEGTK